MDSQFTKRLKSLLWRAGMMGVAAIVTFLSAHLIDLQVSPTVTAVIGLVLGEVSKWLNTATT